MKIEQVSHMLRCASEDMVNPRYRTKFKEAADAIDAHLAPRDVSDEDVERAITAFNRELGPYAINSYSTRYVAGLRAALQADRQRGGGAKVLPSELQGAIDYLMVVTCSSHLPGWKKNREMWDIVWKALLAQRGQVQEGCGILIDRRDLKRLAKNALHHAGRGVNRPLRDKAAKILDMLAAAPDAAAEDKT